MKEVASLFKTVFTTGFGMVPILTWFATRPAVYSDGLLWVIIGMGTAAVSELGSEAAYKYIEPNLLFKLKLGSAVVLGGAVALKTFRSTSYSKHIDDTEDAAALSSTKTSTVTKGEGETTVETSKKVVTEEPKKD